MVLFRPEITKLKTWEYRNQGGFIWKKCVGPKKMVVCGFKPYELKCVVMDEQGNVQESETQAYSAMYDAQGNLQSGKPRQEFFGDPEIFEVFFQDETLTNGFLLTPHLDALISYKFDRFDLKYDGVRITRFRFDSKMSRVGSFYDGSKWSFVTVNPTGQSKLQMFDFDGREIKDVVLHGSGLADVRALTSDHVTEVYVEKMIDGKYPQIVLIGKAGIHIFDFPKTHEIRTLYKENKVFYPNSKYLFGKMQKSPGKYKDIVEIGRLGINVYSFIQDSYWYSRRAPNNLATAQSAHLADMDGDGIDELMFTDSNGIHILSYNEASSTWQTMLEPKDLDPESRFGNIVGVQTAPDSVPHLLIATQDNLMTWKTSIGKFCVADNPIAPQSTFDSRLSLQSSAPIQQVLPLRDVIDYKIFHQCVEPRTGKAKFTIPLMNRVLDSFQFLSLSYNGNNQKAGVLGHGWSMPSFFIVMDDQLSDIRFNHKYYLHTPTFVDEIYLINGSMVYFESFTNKDLHIEYKKENEHWICKSDSTILHYGSAKAAVSYDVDRKLTASTARIWYLTRIENTFNEAYVNFEYESTDAATTWGQPYTKDNYLSKITATNNNKFNTYDTYDIKFNYLQKEEKELPEFDNTNDDLSNIDRRQYQYMKGYELETPKFLQKIIFDYKLEKNKRLLTGITQETEVDPVLKFNYDDHGAMTNIITGNNLQVDLEYTRLPKFITPPPVTINSKVKSKFTYGESFNALSYEINGRVFFKVFKQDMSGQFFEGAVPDTKMDIKDYVLVPTSNMFTIVTENYAEKRIFIFAKSGDSFNAHTPIQINLAPVRFGLDFVLYVDERDRYIKLIRFDRFEKILKDNSQAFHCWAIEKVLIAAHKSSFVTYCDPNLILYTIDYNEQKKEVTFATRTINTLQGVYTDSLNTLDKFQMNHQIKKNYVVNHLRTNALQLNGNFIVMNTLLIEKVKMYLTLTTQLRVCHITQNSPIEEYKIPNQIVQNLKEDNKVYLYRHSGNWVAAKRYCSTMYGYCNDNTLDYVDHYYFPISNYLVQVKENLIITEKHMLKFNGQKWLDSNENIEQYLDKMFDMTMEYISDSTPKQLKFQNKFTKQYQYITTDKDKYKITPSNNIFTLVVDKGVEHIVYVFYKKADKSFGMTHYYQNPPDLVRYGNDFTVMVRANKGETSCIFVQTYDDIQKTLLDKTVYECASLPLIDVEQNIFAIYCDPKLTVYTRRGSQWLPKDYGTAFDNFESTHALDQFPMDNYATTKKNFRENGLRIINNFAVLFGFKYQNYVVTGRFAIKSIYSDQPAQIFPVMSGVRKLKPHRQRQRDGSINWHDIESINFDKYLPGVQRNQIEYDDQLIVYNGMEWIKPDKSKSKSFYVECGKTIAKPTIPISDNFKLQKDNVEKDTHVHFIKTQYFIDVNSNDTGISNILEFRNGFPNYVAYKNRNSRLSVIEFKNFGEDVHHEDQYEPNEVIHPDSKEQILITQIFTDTKTKIIFRPMLFDEKVITKQTLLFNNKKRSYDFKYQTTSSLEFNNVVIIPEGEKNRFGYIENTATDKAVTTKVYNSEGQLVDQQVHSSPDAPNQTDEKERHIYKQTTLLDKNRRMEIAQFYPHKLDDEEVAYYGFEEYELNQIGQAGRWSFPPDRIKQTNALTGYQYLQLEPNESFEGLLKPANENISYRVSVWMSVEATMKIGTKTSLLHADIFTRNGQFVSSALGFIKASRGDWFLVEAIVSMPVLLKLNADGPLQVRATVSSDKYAVHVDHILFTPVFLTTEVSIYNTLLWKKSAIITSSGLIKNLLYDQYSNLVGVVNEYNQVTEIVSTSKLSSGVLKPADGTNFRHSLLKVTSNDGFYEKFDKASLQRRWTLVGVNPDVTLKLREKPTSMCIRFRYKIGVHGKIHVANPAIRFSHNSFSYGRITQTIKPRGEVVLLFENDNLSVFLDGILRIDNVKMTNNGPLTIVTDNIRNIVDMVIMKNPSITLTYFNALNEVIQTVRLVNSNSVIRQHYHYDALGRKEIEKLPELVRVTDNSALFAFTPHSRDLRSGREDLRIFTYENDSTNQIKAVKFYGLQSAANPELKHHSRLSQQNDPVYRKLLQLYPNNKGFTYHVERIPGDAEELSILNTDNKRVVRFVFGRNNPGILSTYEYDSAGQITRVEPPNAFTEYLNNIKNGRPVGLPTPAPGWSTTYEYTSDGSQKRLTVPDAGDQDFIYTSDGSLKFMVSFTSTKAIFFVTYFNYDTTGAMTECGEISNLRYVTMEQLINAKEDDITEQIFTVQPYQQFSSNVLLSDPFIRQNRKRITTIYKNSKIVEEFLTNLHGYVFSKRVYLPKNGGQLMAISIYKQYAGKVLHRILYPFNYKGNVLIIEYEYNKLDRISVVKNGISNVNLATYEYNAFEGIQKEMLNPRQTNTFGRTYAYNLLGFTTQIDDKYLKQVLNYQIQDRNSPRTMFADGTVMRVSYEAKWQQLALTNLDNKFNTVSIENHGPYTKGVSYVARQIPFPSKYNYVLGYGNDNELITADFMSEGERSEPKFSFKYEIDSNGNFKHITMNQNYLGIRYHTNSNKINTINVKTPLNDKTFNLAHDDRGNVVQAPHKDITAIKYNYILNQINRIEKSDCVLEFEYDSRGGRISKTVFTEDKTRPARKYHYIRDEAGQCLVERETIYQGAGKPPSVTTTAYVYGPRGLLGFYRRDKYYNVLTDHTKSVRLIEQAGQIVAAFDYSPYGILIRKFGNNPESQIPYGFTGQEFDQETGLYYFQARYYDPEIGRFYQMDPKGQFFNPYKYAGNSPLSKVDPSGEIIITLIVMLVLAIIFGYLGGAAANKNFNPLKWEWNCPSTWMGIISGAIAGATAPLGAIGAVGALTSVFSTMSAAVAWSTVLAVGAGFTYIKTAISQGSANPADWEWNNPAVLNDIFQSFATGTGLIGGFAGAKAMFGKLSYFGKFAFVATATTLAVGSFIVAGNANDWDFSKNGWVAGALLDFITIPDTTKSLFDAVNFVKFVKSFKNFKATIAPGSATLKSFFSATRNKILTHVAQLAIGLTMAGVSGASSDFDMTSFSTYKSMLDGFLMGRQIVGGVKDFKEFKNPPADEAVKMIKEVTPLTEIFRNDKLGVALVKAGKENMAIMGAVATGTLISVVSAASGPAKAVKQQSMQRMEQLYKGLPGMNVAEQTPTQPEAKYQYMLAKVEHHYKNLKTPNAVDQLKMEDIKRKYSEAEEEIQSWTIDQIEDKKSSKQCYIINNDQKLRLDFRYIDSLLYKTMYPCESDQNFIMSISYLSDEPLSNVLITAGPTTHRRFLEPIVEIESNKYYQKRSIGKLYNSGEVKHSRYLIGKHINDCLVSMNRSRAELNQECVGKHSTPMEQTQLVDQIPYKGGLPQQNVSFTPDYSITDVNSSLLLLDLCVRKVTGEKYIVDCNDPNRFFVAQIDAMNIIEDFENLLGDVAEFAKESLDFPRIQCKVFESLVSGHGSQVPDLLMTTLKEALVGVDLEERMKILFYVKAKCTNTY